MRVIEQLTEQDKTDLFRWSDKVFPEEGAGMSWRPPSHHIVLQDKGRAIAHIGFLESEISVPIFGTGDIHTCKVIGVGGVVVRPEYQKQGIPKKMFEYLHSRAPGILGTHLFSLFCPARLVNYYKQHGYLEYPAPVSVLQQGSSQAIHFCFMTFGDHSLEGPIDLNSEPW